MDISWATKGKLAPTQTIEEPLLPAGVCVCVLENICEPVALLSVGQPSLSCTDFGNSLEQLIPWSQGRPRWSGNGRQRLQLEDPPFENPVLSLSHQAGSTRARLFCSADGDRVRLPPISNSGLNPRAEGTWDPPASTNVPSVPCLHSVYPELESWVPSSDTPLWTPREAGSPYANIRGAQGCPSRWDKRRGGARTRP